MGNLGVGVGAALVLLASAATVSAQAPTGTVPPPPTWAFTWIPAKQPPPNEKPQRIPGSDATFSEAQARDLFFAPDWYPQDHSPMPDIVARGRKPNVRACGLCHRVEGTGGPENASVAGLPVSYFVQQMADIKSGARKLSGPFDKSGNVIMRAIANEITDEEVQAAAKYYAGVKPKRNIKVVEADTIPKTLIARLFFHRDPDGGTEALGRRIVEMPEDFERFELRDSRMQFTAYVPFGSTAKGETLAKTAGGGTTVACGTCHGPDLRGVGPIPRIAGRSPTYIVRQLYDFKYGGRSAPSSALMKAVVEKLTEEDMIALAAYVGSLEP